MSTVDYPVTKEVAELFDITVLSDLESFSNDENDYRSKPVVALGWHGEPAAGIRYGVVSPWFATMDELEAFCTRNLERFREEAKKCDEGAPIPDASEWK